MDVAQEAASSEQLCLSLVPQKESALQVLISLNAKENVQTHRKGRRGRNPSSLPLTCVSPPTFVCLNRRNRPGDQLATFAQHHRSI